MEENITKIFAKNLNKLMTDRHENLTQLSDRIDVAYSTVSDWQHGRKMPRSGSLQKLANHFGVNLTYLTSNHDDETGDAKSIDLADKGTIFTYEGKEIPEQDMEYIKRILRGGRP